MAAHGADAVERRAGQGQQMVVHPLEMLADDVEARIGHQMVDVGDPSGDRVLDRDHREPRRAVAHRREGVLERGAGQARHLRKNPAAGQVGIGSRRALKGDRPAPVLGSIGLTHSDHLPSAGEIGRRIDLHADLRLVDQADPDAHPGFERAQLFEPLALFENAARQGHKAVERGAAIGVEADMLVMRSVAPRHRRLAEIERARRTGPVGEPGRDLVDAGVGERRRIGDLGRQGRDIGVGFAERRQRDADRGGIEHRHVALDIDDGVMGPPRIERRERRVDAVRAGRQRRIGHHGASAGALDRFGDLAVGAGDDDRAAIGGDRQAPDMHDHRRAGDVGQRLVRAAGWRRAAPGSAEWGCGLPRVMSLRQ